MNNISIRMVENLFVDENGIYALSKQKERTKVFLRQGNLDYSCVVYSFLMMLILKGKIVRGDLERHYDHKGDELVEMIRKNLIYNLNGPAKGGMSAYDLAKKINKWNLGIQVESFTSVKNYKDRAIPRKQLIDYIEQNVAQGNPVLICFYNLYDDYGHAVLAVGYSKLDETIMVYCIDPASSFMCCSLWNEFIEIRPNEEQDYIYSMRNEVIVHSATTILPEQTYFDIPEAENINKPF